MAFLQLEFVGALIILYILSKAITKHTPLPNLVRVSAAQEIRKRRLPRVCRPHIVDGLRNGARTGADAHFVVCISARLYVCMNIYVSLYTSSCGSC